jgi:shikimate dehydrogenase
MVTFHPPSSVAASLSYSYYNFEFMLFGLLGYPISQSFSRPYFTRKFADLGLSATHEYQNFEVKDLGLFPDIIRLNPTLRGLNVTIPHKQTVIPYLDELDTTAQQIGAVNTILISNGKTKGYNTDLIGFKADFEAFAGFQSSTEQDLEAARAKQRQLSLQSLRGSSRRFGRRDANIDRRALVLGTGGASLAVLESMRQLDIPTTLVSRRASAGQLTYQQVNHDVIKVHRYIINCTPLGATYLIDQCPDIPYEAISDRHFCYDLVYNPAETLFLRKAKLHGAKTSNGLGMLHGQAEAAWAIWKD